MKKIVHRKNVCTYSFARFTHLLTIFYNSWIKVHVNHEVIYISLSVALSSISHNYSLRITDWSLYPCIHSFESYSIATNLIYLSLNKNKYSNISRCGNTGRSSLHISCLWNLFSHIIFSSYIIESYNVCTLKKFYFMFLSLPDRLVFTGVFELYVSTLQILLN